MTTLTIDRSKKWTVDDYMLLDEDLRCEIIDAELIMTPAPTTKHQRISKALFLKMSHFIKGNGELFYAPIDIYFNEENVLQPDLVFIKRERLGIVQEKGIIGTPDLIVEIISPSNSYIDRYLKKRKYAQFGVQEYWIVDPGNKTIEVYNLGEGHEYGLTLFVSEEGDVKSSVLEGLTFELSEIFV